jgi:hypothetical protein
VATKRPNMLFREDARRPYDVSEEFVASEWERIFPNSKKAVLEDKSIPIGDNLSKIADALEKNHSNKPDPVEVITVFKGELPVDN